MKTVDKYDASGNFIERYESMADAAEANGIGIAEINDVYRNRRVTAGGYFWKFPTDAVDNNINLRVGSKHMNGWAIDVIEQYGNVALPDWLFEDESAADGKGYPVSSIEALLSDRTGKTVKILKCSCGYIAEIIR